MLKKIMLSVIALCVLGAGTVSASETEIPEGKEVDSVSGASVTDYYGDFGMSGDELMEAVNAPSGSYVIATVNEDGTPLAGFFVYSMLNLFDVFPSVTRNSVLELLNQILTFLGLIGVLVKRISLNINPKRRKPADILKGVRTDDPN